MDNIIKQWNNAALKYTQAQENSEYVQINKNTVKNRFPCFNGEKILDLGCGYGFYTDYFVSIGANAVGIDGSEKMIEIARKQYPMSEFHHMNIMKPLEFEEGSFDVVFSNQVLMDVENIDFVFSECKRVLKNKGILYFSIVHPAFYDGKWIKDENGYCRAKALEKYISHYRVTNDFWGETEHYHRPLSYYLNAAAKNGFMLKEVNEPVSYDGKRKNSDIPLFFFAEYIKLHME
ncbi:MAG: class I SAM-dependent methyltransferase [Ruminiclostridium sp.]|jgi:2-polyprenyl-3-methyl-5-hydroxy-6-metoxy-1,4-benzoquinol methylase|nr:class I SAM-dependent methyltransferase [Ruminiclostridium sp.]